MNLGANKLKHRYWQSFQLTLIIQVTCFSLLFVSYVAGWLILPLWLLVLHLCFWIVARVLQYLAFVKGLTKHLNDPELSFFRIWFSITNIMFFAFFFTSEMRPLQLVLASSPILFSMLRLNSRQSLHLVIYPITYYGLTFFLLLQYAPERVNPAIETTRLIFFSAFWLWLALFSGFFSRLRAKLRDKSRALAEANQRFVEAQDQLLQTAHKAGMAEVASEFLHDIGHTINSIGISVSALRREAQNFPSSIPMKTAKLLRRNQQQLSEFLSDRNRSDQLIDALEQFAVAESESRLQAEEEFRNLARLMEQIHAILTTHRRYTLNDMNWVENGSIQSIVESAAASQSAAFNYDRVEVQLHIDELPNVLFHRSKLRQVFVHLFNNAREALSQLPNSSPRKLTVHAGLTTDAEVVVSVSDNGPGIPPEHQEQVFNHGFSTKNALGHGLHYCANAMQQMGGSITLANGPDGGALFTLTLKAS